MMKRRVYLSDFTGLCNRLESLPLSFAIEEKFGHQVCLDWPELDAFTVAGTVRAAMPFWRRPGSLKIRHCDRTLFDSLRNYRTIVQRGMEGPEEVLDTWYHESARRIRLNPDHAGTIRQMLARYAGRPIIGVHIRRGDFVMQAENDYDVTRAWHQGVPLWWYEFVMGEYARYFPGTCFLLSCTGSGGEYAQLRQKFEVFETPLPSPYGYKGPGHSSEKHPVLDLFALACCSVILTTPASSFSHFAAHVLGPQTTAILPASPMNRKNPGYGYVQLHGQRLPAWTAASRERVGFVPVTDAAQMPTPAPPETDWL